MRTHDCQCKFITTLYKRKEKGNIKPRKWNTRLGNCTHKLNSIREASYSSRCIIPQRIFSTHNSQLNKIYAEIKLYVVWKYMHRMFRVMCVGESPSIYHHSHFIQAIRLCNAAKHYRNRFSKRPSGNDTPIHWSSSNAECTSFKGIFSFSNM